MKKVILSNINKVFSDLAKLSNDTKVSISTIGLPEAMNKMFRQDWTARRLGSTIQADFYCGSYDYFEMNLNKLLKYNWLKYPIEVTKEGIDTLFKLTNGTIAYLISFYMRIQLNNINNNNQVKLTKEYVEEIMNKYYYGLVKILTNSEGKTCKDIQEKEIERLQIINKVNDEFNAEINKKLQEAEMAKQLIEQKLESQDENEIEITQYIIKMIQIFDSTKDENEIIKCLKQIVQSYKKKNLDLNKEELLRLTVDKLKKHPRRSA